VAQLAEMPQRTDAALDQKAMAAWRRGQTFRRVLGLRDVGLDLVRIEPSCDLFAGRVACA
jgi:hypothetical protein